MAYHGDILMTPNPVYAEVSAIQKEKEAAAASQEAVNLWQACKKYDARKVITCILLPSFLLVLLCLIVALLVVTVAPSQPVPSSCADIIESSPLSVSGYYVMRSSSGSLVQVYCDMGVVCDGSRGWMRLMGLYYRSSLRNSSTCSTVESFSTPGIQYSRVCGKLIGYTTIYFHYITSEVCVMPPFNAQVGIDDPYVTGFSITHGRPRQHIWSLASSYEEGDWCPDFDGSKTPPEFVGKNYLLGSCDLSYYSTCEFDSNSWFIVNLTEPVSDNIELRACSGFYDENIENFYFGSTNLMILVQ